ncbi:MAG TPA: hypothetical protein VKT77_19610 [Chthonomonadaceae bacterium]|nr:hypothetical protein [Chthonomonadaceae bacterium]
MTAAPIICLCHEPLREGANFCARCGREVRQLCPICFEERRLIAGRDLGAAPWCCSRGELLCACARCGRWLPANVAQCPDPACRGAVGLTWPVSTGRAPDGSGRAESWTWPAAWDRENPTRTEPVIAQWVADAPIYSGFAAHGRLALWTENSLVAPSGPGGGPLAGGEDAAAEPPWRCWLGFDGQPHPAVHAAGHAAVVGGAVVLAAMTGFLLAGLDASRTDEVVPLEVGTPLAQVAAEGWWVAWSEDRGAPALWIASSPASWRSLACQRIADTPASAAPRAGSPLILQGGMACWIDAEGGVWRLNCRCRDLQHVAEPIPGIQRLWRDGAGIHVARGADEGVRVALGGGLETGGEREVAGGAGPLRDVFASADVVAVVGRQVTALSPTSGDRTGEGKVSGRWIAGALAAAAPASADREPRLLMLAEEGGIGSLTALRSSSGVADVLWRGHEIRPIALIAAGESLYVVHDRGVIRIREKA